MKKPKTKLELIFWLIVIYVSWLVISSCNVKVVPRTYYTSVKKGCLQTTFRGFIRTDTLIEGCDCKTFKSK